MKLYENFHQKSFHQKKIINKGNFTYRHVVEILEKNLRGGKDILDIGCGAGTLSLYFSHLGYTVDGIDISKKAIDSCEKSAQLLNLNNIHFYVVDFPNHTPKKKYDFIICSEVLEHLKNDRLAVKKIYDLLNGGGMAVITTPSVNAPLYRLGLADKFDKEVGHLRRYSLAKLIAMCKSERFEIISSGRTEGILRNFLYLNPIAGKLIRYIKFFIADLITMVDTVLLRLFGESNIFVVLKKSK